MQYTTLPDAPNIRKFVFEHACDVNSVARTWTRRYGELVKPMNNLLKLTDSDLSGVEAARGLVAAKEAVI